MALTRTALTAAIGRDDLILTVTSTTGATLKGLCIINEEYSWVQEIISSTQVRVRHRGANGGRATTHAALSPVRFCLPSDLPDFVQPSGEPTSEAQITLSADGAIPLPTRLRTRVLVTKGSIAALTLANPDVTVPEGAEIDIVGQSAFAHTVTYTPGFQQQGATGDVASFAAGGGGVLTLKAYAGKWAVKASGGVTFA